MGQATPENAFYGFAKNGASSDMAVDGSSTAVHFDVSASSGPLYIERCNVEIIDGAITPTKFGGVAALANGLLVKVASADGTTDVFDFLDGASIKKNADWVLLAGVDNPVSAAAGDDEFSVRWTLSKGLGEPLYLAAGRRLRFTVQDDLSGLTSFQIMAQGRTG